jgi:hypothetical protein
MIAILDLVARNGIPFRVVFYHPGESGPYPAAADPEHPIVEFYVRRFPHTDHGQFVSRYYADTILRRGSFPMGPGPLNLDGGIPAWNIDADSMVLVRDFLTHHHPAVVDCCLRAGHVPPCTEGVAQVPPANLCRIT